MQFRIFEGQFVFSNDKMTYSQDCSRSVKAKLGIREIRENPSIRPTVLKVLLDNSLIINYSWRSQHDRTKSILIAQSSVISIPQQAMCIQLEGVWFGNLIESAMKFHNPSPWVTTGSISFCRSTRRWLLDYKRPCHCAACQLWRPQRAVGLTTMLFSSQPYNR